MDIKEIKTQRQSHMCVCRYNIRTQNVQISFNASSTKLMQDRVVQR